MYHVLTTGTQTICNETYVITLIAVKNAKKESMAIHEQFISLKQIQISDDSASCVACVQRKLVMQILTNNVLTYNAGNNRFLSSLDRRSECSH